jgi:hypothetical protein
MNRFGMYVLIIAATLLVTAVPVGMAADDDGERQQWVQRYQELQSKHARLGKDLEQARSDYSRGRSSRHPRGEGKAALIGEIQRLEGEFEKVDRQLQDFPEEARRQGALPGWFRDVEAPTHAGAQPAAIQADPEPSRVSSRAAERNKKRSNRRLGRD